MIAIEEMAGVFEGYYADYEEFNTEETVFLVTNRKTLADWRVTLATDQSILEYEEGTGYQDRNTGIWEDPGTLTSDGADPYEQLPDNLYDLFRKAKRIEFVGRDGDCAGNKSMLI